MMSFDPALVLIRKAAALPARARVDKIERPSLLVLWTFAPFVAAAMIAMTAHFVGRDPDRWRGSLRALEA